MSGGAGETAELGRNNDVRVDVTRGVRAAGGRDSQHDAQADGDDEADGNPRERDVPENDGLHSASSAPASRTKYPTM